MNEIFDIAIIGAGMAGASLAAELAAHARVILLEAEDRPGYHATGRSAAFWTESYGGPLVQPLTSASGPYLEANDCLRPRGALTIAPAGSEANVKDFCAEFAGSGVRMEVLGRAELAARISGLKSGWTQGVSEPDCTDIDVARLHAHYLALAGKHGAQTICRFRLATAVREGDVWTLQSENGQKTRARCVVNAAGAWADPVAEICGVSPLGIRPFRRTIVQLKVDPRPPADLPLVIDLDGGFYFKPENGSLWLSPHDETPSPPCDAAPEELDVALAIDRLEQVVDWNVQRVEHKWAGLRSFAPDRLPVYGFDKNEPHFFWFAGQGGFGIQTAPAAARLAAQLLLGLPRDGMTAGLDATLYAPGRFS